MKKGDLVKYWAGDLMHRGIIVGQEGSDWEEPIWKVLTNSGNIMKFYESNLKAA